MEAAGEAERPGRADVLAVILPEFGSSVPAIRRKRRRLAGAVGAEDAVRPAVSIVVEAWSSTIFLWPSVT